MTNKTPTISAVVTTFNSGKTLDRCLASLHFVDEIIVVDSGSTDNTVAITQQYKAKLYSNPWEGYGTQKNFGLEQATSDWVIFLDSDEEIYPALAQRIPEVLEHPEHHIYWIKVVDFFLGHPLTHLHGNNPRLLQKGFGKWDNSPVHEQMLDGDGIPVKLGGNNSGRIPEAILHHSHTSLASYLTKMHKYTTLDASKMAQRDTHRSGLPVKPSFSLPYYLSIRQFVKLLFYRRGILDGIGGIEWSFLSAYYEFEMGQKYLALKKSNPQVN